MQNTFNYTDEYIIILSKEYYLLPQYEDGHKKRNIYHIQHTMRQKILGQMYVEHI